MSERKTQFEILLWIAFLFCFPAFYVVWGTWWFMVVVAALALALHVTIAVLETRS